MNKIFAIALPLLLLAGCADKNMIPDDDLKAIISDAYLTDSYLREFGSRYDRDTLTFFAPILERYGYTMEDMRHTLNVMANRKTNVLEPIIEAASEEYSRRLARYRRGYDISLRWDTMALRRATLEVMLDSLYARSIPDLKKASFELPLYNSGVYTIAMSYRIDSADLNKSYLIRYILSDTLGRSVQNSGSIWLGRVGRKTLSSTDVTVNADRYNHMSIDFLSVASGKSVREPSIRVDTMTVTYRPSIEIARKMNYDKYFGIFNRDTSEFTFYENKKDSSALRVPFRVPYAVGYRNGGR